MRLYPHWLDGDYAEIARRDGEGVTDTRAEAILKLYAVFGVNVAISDAQLVDSSALWQAFRDEGFRHFLRQNDDFLELRARLEGDHASNIPFGVTVAGPERALKTEMFSAPISNIGVGMRRGILEKIVHAGPSVDVDSLHALLRGDGPDTKHVAGLLHAFDHFLRNPRRAVVVEHPRTSYLEKLDEALGNRRLGPEARRHIEGTTELLGRLVPNPDERARRAKVREAMRKGNQEGEWSPEFASAWQTVVAAWNCAAQDTVAQHGGSVGNLSQAPTVAVYVNEPREIVLSGQAMPNPPAASMLARLLNCGVSELSWEQIGALVDRVGPEREKLRTALSRDGAESCDSALNDYSAALVSKMPPARRPIPSLLWVTVGPTLALLGLPELGGAILAGRTAEWLFDGVIKSARHRIVATTVRGAWKEIGRTRVGT